MKIQIKFLLLVLSLLAAANSTRAASIVWTNTAGGNWSDTNNWNPNQMPGGADTAVITNAGAYTVALDVSPAVGGLVLGAAGGAQNLSISNSQAFTLNGAAVINAGGHFNLLAGGVLGGNVSLNGALNCIGGTLSGGLTVGSNSVLNLGTLDVNLTAVMLTNYGTVNWTGGNLQCNSGPQIYNYGLWTAQADNTFVGQVNFGNGVFNNFGTFRKSGGTGVTILDGDAIFNGTGTVDVQGGTVSIDKGQVAGAINTAGGAFFSAGSHLLFTGSTVFSGAGGVEGILVGNNALLGGTVNGSGILFSGTITMVTNGVLNLGTVATALNAAYAGTCLLTNYGTMNSSCNLNCDNGPQIYNYGLWNDQADNTFSGASASGTTALNNYGTFRKSGGGGVTTLDVNMIFTNSGTLDVQSGTMSIDNGQMSGAVSLAGGAIFSPGNHFNFTGSTLFSGAGKMTGLLSANNAVFSGTLNCSGTTLSGSMTVVSNSVLNLGPVSVNLNGVVLTNYGTANWIGGDLMCSFSPQVFNYGLWNAGTDNTFVGEANGFGNGTFNNAGTFQKSGGTGVTSFDGDAAFNGTGTLDVQSGTVSTYRGRINGAVNIAGGAVFSMTSQNALFTGGTLFSGPGNVSGFLTGSNAVFNGALNCSGVTISGAITISTNAVVNLGALNVSFNTSYGGVGVLTNYGTVNWGAGNINCDTSPQIYNYGFWNAQTDGVFSGQQTSGTTTFNNSGTFQKSGGTGSTALDASTFFNNSGTVNVQGGTMSINSGLARGTAGVSAGATLLPGNNFIFAGTNLFTGAGNTAGLLAGSNAVFSGVLNCSGTTLAGTMTVASNSVLNLGAVSVNLDSLALTNYGAANWTGGNLICNNSPQIYNYGLWNAQTDNTFVGRFNFGNGTFNNFGAFNKSAGTGTTSFDADSAFNGTGAISVQSGTLAIQQGQDSGTVTTAAGTFISPGSRVIFKGGTVFSGSGKIANLLIGSNAVFSGVLNLSGATLSGAITVASNAVVNLGSTRIVFDASYAGIGLLTNYGTVNWSAGNFTGDNNPKIYNYGLWNDQADHAFSGQISSGSTTFNNPGTFRKSGTSGTTSIDDFTVFNNTGTLDVQSGTVSFVTSPALAGGTLNFGINSSNNFGRVTFSGAVALAGTAAVNLNNLYSPAAGSSFALLAYASKSGTFTSLNVPVLPGLVWTNNYGATAFTLTVLPAAAPVLSSGLTNGANFSIHWPALGGQNYQLQFTTNLVPANWINLGAPLSIPTNGTLSAVDALGTNSQRFYRVLLQ